MLRASLLLCIVAAACSAPHVARLPEPLVTPRAAALRAKAAHKEAARELEIDSSSNGDGIVGISAMTSQTTDSYGTKRRRQITRQISHLLSQTAPKLRQKQTKGSAEHHTEYKGEINARMHSLHSTAAAALCTVHCYTVFAVC